MGTPKDIALPDAVEQELSATQEILDAFSGWLRGLRSFFIEANALELAAQDTLAKARLVKAPKTAEDDAAIQRSIISANQAAKHAEETWAITKSVSALHKRLTAKRSKAVDPNKEAAAVLQGLHNVYVAEARRKAEAEAAKLQKKEDAKAIKQDRPAEVVTVAPKIEKAGSDRTNWSAEITDMTAFRKAVADGLIPDDVLIVNQPALNSYARSLKGLLNNWPGVRAVSTTKTIG